MDELLPYLEFKEDVFIPRVDGINSAVVVGRILWQCVKTNGILFQTIHL